MDRDGLAYRHLGPAHRRAALPAPEDRLIEFIIIIALLGWMAWFGLAAARSATRLDRVAPTWFAFGAVLGPIALLLLQSAPPGRCPSCSTPTRGWLSICLWCGERAIATPSEGKTLVPKLPGLSIGRTWMNSHDQARPIKQIPIRILPPPPSAPISIPAPAPMRSGRAAGRTSPPRAPISTPAPAPMHREPPSPPSAPVTPLGNTAGPELDGSRPLIRATRAPASNAAEEIESAPIETRILTTAVYVTGSTSMESGRRYMIAIHGTRLRILGPVDLDPSTVALDRELAGMDATASGARLVITGPGGRSGTVLVFMSVAGTTPDTVASAIIDAARTAARA